MKLFHQFIFFSACLLKYLYLLLELKFEKLDLHFGQSL